MSGGCRAGEKRDVKTNVCCLIYQRIATEGKVSRRGICGKELHKSIASSFQSAFGNYCHISLNLSIALHSK